MTRFGEIISLDNSTALIRLYKEKHGEMIAGALTLRAECAPSLSIGDMALINIPLLPFVISSLSAYVLPFVVTVLTVIITRIFTKNLIFCEAAVLICLLLTYALSSRAQKLSFFKKPLCKATKRT